MERVPSQRDGNHTRREGGDGNDEKRTKSEVMVNKNNSIKMESDDGIDDSSQTTNVKKEKDVMQSKAKTDLGQGSPVDDTKRNSETDSQKISSPRKESSKNNTITKDTSSSTTTTTTTTTKSQQNNSEPTKQQKLKVHFVAVGSAPILKKSKFLISPKESFARLQEKLSKMLQLKDSSSSSSSSNLFLYLHQSFVPSPEDLIGDLHSLFSVREELILHYSLQEAWG